MNKDDENFNTNNKNNNTSNGNIISTSSSSWLGFSLSPTLNIDQQQQLLQEVETEHVTACSDDVIPTAIPTCIFDSQSNTVYNNNHNNINYDMHYGSDVEDENGCGLSSSHFLPVMPLKSDGSLSLMKAVTKRQQQQQTPDATMVTTTSITPKLEDFFGGSSSTMALSLDSIYYNQTNLSQKQEIRFENYPFHTNFFGDHGTFSLVGGGHGTSAETQVSNFNLQLPVIREDEVSDMKSWFSKNYISNHAMDTNNGNENAPSSTSTESLSAITYGNLQCLSLSMSPSSQSSSVTGNQQISHVLNECEGMETRKRGPDLLEQKQAVVHRKSIDTFGQRTSQYRGVTRHRWTGRYEAHLWDNSCKKEGQSRKGRQGQ